MPMNVPTRSKRILPALLLLLLPAGSLYALNDWDKAVEIFGSNDSYHPYLLDITSHTYGGNGKLEKTETQSFRLDYKNGFENPDRDLLKATEDGKDVTEKLRKELEKSGSNRRGGPGGEMEGMEKHPLDADVQHEVLAYDTGKREYTGGRSCSLWSFEIQLNDKYRGIGSAWLDTESHAAVRIEYRIDPLIPFVDKMSISMEYGGNPESAWTMSRLTMSGTVNMIITRKSFESVMRFSDYR